MPLSKVGLALAAFMLVAGTASAAERLRIGGTGSSLGTIRTLAEAFSKVHGDVSVEVPRSLGSTGGIKAVVAGAIDIGLASRPLKPEEAAAGASEIQYATTAFVFVTSNDGAVALSRQEVVDIFSGTKRVWAGGQPIRVVLRPESDSDSDFLVQTFPDAAQSLSVFRRSKIGVPVAASDQDNLDAAERLPGSFATSSLSAVLSEGRRLTALALDGVVPSVATIEDGSYPFTRALYFVTVVGRPSATVQAFIDFVGSAEGQTILRQTGNFPFETAS